MVVSFYFGGKSHVSNGCKMYLLRTPAEFLGFLNGANEMDSVHQSLAGVGVKTRDSNGGEPLILGTPCLGCLCFFRETKGNRYMVCPPCKPRIEKANVGINSFMAGIVPHPRVTRALIVTQMRKQIGAK